MARKMKDSGIEWIGEIPEGWEIIPVKYLAKYNYATLAESCSPDFEFSYIDIGSVTYTDGITNYQNFKFKDAPSRARRIVHSGDILVSTVRTYLRAVACVNEHRLPQIASTGFLVLQADTSKIHPHFLMLRDIWVPLLSGIIGGLFTLIGVILTIKHERKKDISEHLQEIKPYLVIVHPSEVKRSEWNSQRYIYMLDDENDFDEDDVSTPLYRWDYLCLSNIGSSIGILKYIKVNEDIYSFDENSAIRPDECYQIHGSRLTNFTSGHVNSIHLGLYDKCFNFYEYNISFSIKELAPRDHPRENEKLLHFDTIDCVHNLYRPKQSFIGSFFHHRF